MLPRRTSTLAVLLALGAVAIVALSPAAGASGGKMKCSSFASQKAAQKYFVRKGGSQSKNVSGLDPDGDGLVCPDNPGPFAAYVELAFAKGFFYGTVVCADYQVHRSKAEVRGEEKAEEEAVESRTKFKARGCNSAFIEVELREAKPGEDPVAASHKAEAAEAPTLLPLGASEKNEKGSVLSFEFKLEPRSTKGTFYALSEECFGTPSRNVQGG